MEKKKTLTEVLKEVRENWPPAKLIFDALIEKHNEEKEILESELKSLREDKLDLTRRVRAHENIHRFQVDEIENLKKENEQLKKSLAEKDIKIKELEVESNLLEYQKRFLCRDCGTRVSLGKFCSYCGKPNN